jgi:hypothetical protein
MLSEELSRVADEADGSDSSGEEFAHDVPSDEPGRPGDEHALNRLGITHARYLESRGVVRSTWYERGTKR